MDDKESTVKERMLDFIQTVRGVTFAELLNRYGDMRGDFSVGPEEDFCPKNVTVIFCSGLSDETCKAFIELLSEKKIRVSSGNLLCYLADGGYLDLPLFTGKPHKKPITQWYPAILNPRKVTTEDE